MSPIPLNDSCSYASQQIEEFMPGTVKQTRAWILIEDSEPPGAKALRDSNIPDRVKTRLEDLTDHLPASKVLLIRGGPPEPAGVRMFCVNSCEYAPRLYRFVLSSYNDLLDFDFEALFAGLWSPQEAVIEEPLFLVCTNGRRDPCCTRLGLPAYESLAAQESGSAWQTSHVGGHRFAPNMVCFPRGIFYGRAAPERIVEIASEYRAGRLVPDLYRGRACYPKPAQAAEYHLCTHTGRCDLGDFDLDSIEQLGSNEWQVRFMDMASGALHELHLKAEAGQEVLSSGCRKPDDLLHPITYRLLVYRQL